MASKQQLVDPPPPPQWVIDLNTQPIARSKPSSIPDPPGFTSSSKRSTTTASSSKQQPSSSQPTTRKPPTPSEMSTLKLKKAWEVAIAPAKQLPMNGIGMWMTGNSLQIFSIFMVFTLFKGPLQALMNVNATFRRFEGEEKENNWGKMLQVKAVYVAANLLVLSLGVWKVNKMGLLPTTRSDWLAWEHQRMPVERAYPALDT